MVIMSDLTFIMICLVPLEYWADNDDVIRKLVIFTLSLKEGDFTQPVRSVNVAICGTFTFLVPPPE